MSPLPPILVLCAAALLLIAGCSKEKDADASKSAVAPVSTNRPPAVTPHVIARKTDGLWSEANATQAFTGTAVHDENGTRWEQKFEKGTRTAMRAWDRIGKRIELHSWNFDGSQKP